MYWYDMPEKTKKQKLEKEIAEYQYCIHGVCRTMKQMRVPENEWERNVVVKSYLEKIEKAKKQLRR